MLKKSTTSAELLKLVREIRKVVMREPVPQMPGRLDEPPSIPVNCIQGNSVPCGDRVSVSVHHGDRLVSKLEGFVRSAREADGPIPAMMDVQLSGLPWGENQ